MEEILTRFPGVGENIFKQLDYKDLVWCKMVSKFWYNFLDNSSLVYRRRIQKRTHNQVRFKKVWKLITEKASVDILQKLAITVEDYIPKTLKFKFHHMEL